MSKEEFTRLYFKNKRSELNTQETDQFNKYRFLYKNYYNKLEGNFGHKDISISNLSANKHYQQVSLKGRKILYRFVFTSSIFITSLIVAVFIVKIEENATPSNETTNLLVTDKSDMSIKLKSTAILVDGGKHYDLTDMKKIVTDHSVVEVTNSKQIKIKSTNVKAVYQTILTPVRCQYSVRLSDGTEVFLNSNSRLRYPVSFDGKQRDVWLEEGEAFFKVTKHSTPFVVHGKDEIMVLGTSFNYRNYKNETFSELTLVEGKVNIKCQHGSFNILPNEQIEITDQVIVKKVHASSYCSWKDECMQFYNVNFDRFIQSLNQLYGIRIIIKDIDICNKKIVAGIHKDKSLDYNLKLIEKAYNVRFKNNSNHFCLTKN